MTLAVGGSSANKKRKYYDFYPNWYYLLETKREILDLFPLKKFDVWRSGLRIVDFEMKISNAKNISISLYIYIYISSIIIFQDI